MLYGMSTLAETGIVIRAATIADAPALLEMICELAAYGRLSHEIQVTITDLERWLFGNDAAASAIIAVRDSVPIGYAVYFRYFSTFRGQPGMYLEDIYVRESARGLGVGESLIRQVAGIAVEQRCPRLEWIVLDWNESAIGFYRRLGAMPEPKDWTTYAVTDDNLTRLARGEM
jgi:GNAT superfamily N-acetyltransferase